MEIRPYIFTYCHYKHRTRSFQYKTLKNVIQRNIKLHTCGYQKYNCVLCGRQKKKKQVSSFITVVITKNCLKSSQDSLCRLLEWYQIKNKITLRFYRKQTYKKIAFIILGRKKDRCVKCLLCCLCILWT